MAIRSLSSSFLLSLFLLVLAFIKTSHARGIGVCWGQDGREGALNETSKTGKYSYVNIAFLGSFDGGRLPELNLTYHCNPSSNGCKALSTETRDCQRLGIKVMLSIGGPIGSYSSRASKFDVETVATYLWSNFSRGQSKSRPFGATSLDGIDFNIQQGSTK